MKTFANDLDVEEIHRRMARLTSTDQRQFGKMDAGQALCHLREAYRVAADAVPVTWNEKLPLPKLLVKWLALHAPMKWPGGKVKTVRELEAGQPGTVPTEFDADRAGLLEVMERFRGKVGDTPHPIFGAMTRGDWLRWGYLHADHHLRQFGR
jgi:hypothetical protein